MFCSICFKIFKIILYEQLMVCASNPYPLKNLGQGPPMLAQCSRQHRNIFQLYPPIINFYQTKH